MTSKIFMDLLNSLGLLGLFLIIGTFLRAKIRFFQITFIPASVIGGFLLLLLGPICFNFLNIPEEWLKIYSLLPGVLIVPIVASVPLGLKGGFEKKSLKNILPLAFIGIAISMLQFAAGFSAQYIFTNYNFYKTFGWELGIGFVGGHGTAGLLGNMLQSANLDFWEIAQGVATTTATFGLVGGILIGMLLINVASRKNYTVLLKKPGDIPESFKIGYIKNIDEQPKSGRETTLSSSIDSLAFHSAIIFGVCLISFYLQNTIKTYKIPILSKISIWAYSMIVMFIVWKLIKKLKVVFLIDGNIKSRIAGSFTEFAVTAAIASLPIKAVFTYIVPILFIVVFGFIITTFFLIFMCKYFVKDYWFEHMISTFGMATGVFLTGILLLRICDPNFESPVLANYSLSYTITSIAYFAFLNIVLSILLSNGLFAGMTFTFIVGLIFTILAIISSKVLFRE